ncbi:MAG: hypothetical protein MI749_15240 [Desulfovibrionales bacterium]|nr:hypothetical protein [Desulfovibrionales bacterium]
MSDKKVFKNANQVHSYLTAECGYSCSYGKVRDAIAARKLRKRRGGGFSEQEVVQYASAHLELAVDKSTKADRPVEGEDYTPAAKTQAEAKLKAIQAERAQFAFDKERGRYVETSTVEAELGLRARAFTLGLEKFATDNELKVASIFGGNEASAKELCLRLGVDPEEHVATVVDFVLSRTDRFNLLWRKLIPQFLDSYATGVWFDEQMQATWEKLQAQEKDDAA